MSGLVTIDTDGTDTASVGAAFRRETVAAAGFDVTYYEAGEGEPLLCLPGAGGPHMRIALDLLARDYRVILLELPGWGAQPNDVADFDGLAEQVALIATAIGLETFHLMGTSLGGACALHLATLHPERVALDGARSTGEVPRGVGESGRAGAGRIRHGVPHPS